MKRFSLITLALLWSVAALAGGILREDTASQAVMVGPFVDTDGAPVTGLTIDAADVRISKAGANIVAKNSGGCTHDEIGFYTCTFDATDSSTPGLLQIMIAEAGALVVKMDFQVIEEAVYDMLYAASALGYVANAPVNATQISGDTTAADNLELAYDDTAGSVANHGIVDQGTAAAGSAADTFVLRAGQSIADRANAGWTIQITGGTGVGQSRACGAFTTADDTCTISPNWDTTPDNTSVYKAWGTAPGSSGSAPTAAQIVDEWETQSQADPTGFHVNVMEIGGTAQTANDNGADINAILTDTGTTLQAEVDAIQAKTDQLTFTVTGEVDANAKSMNDVEILGAGTEADPWNGE